MNVWIDEDGVEMVTVPVLQCDCPLTYHISKREWDYCNTNRHKVGELVDVWVCAKCAEPYPDKDDAFYCCLPKPRPGKAYSCHQCHKYHFSVLGTQFCDYDKAVRSE